MSQCLFICWYWRSVYCHVQKWRKLKSFFCQTKKICFVNEILQCQNKKAPSQYGCPSTACGRNTRTPLVLCSFLFHFMIWFTEYTFILEQKKDSKTEWIALKHYKHYKHYFSIWFLEKSHMRFNDKSFCEYAPNIIQNLCNIFKYDFEFIFHAHSYLYHWHDFARNPISTFGDACYRLLCCYIIRQRQYYKQRF